MRHLLQPGPRFRNNSIFSGTLASSSSANPNNGPPRWRSGEQELAARARTRFHGRRVGRSRGQSPQSTRASRRRARARATQTFSPNAIVESVLSRNVFTTPADDLALLKPALEAITPADCQAALREDFGGNGRFVSVTGNAKITGDAKAAVASAYKQAHAIAVTPPDADEKFEWAYTDFGPPGKHCETRAHRRSRY